MAIKNEPRGVRRKVTIQKIQERSGFQRPDPLLVLKLVLKKIRGFTRAP